ncbi:glycosyltransferase family 2 protein [Fulvivirga maritima]|uniref:glycosyltransferase family 2 protein n=1 Tax=Fulvivirga maritima TaxID=2904247 RepID=UPI001F24E1EB|nr:glycosyltransferase family A protein [Fulvivirga maritima]UII25506.1 glycosyltransferase family 2 protein [Fulvivirga maritima]
MAINKSSTQKRLMNFAERKLRLFRDKFIRKYNNEQLPAEIYSEDQKFHSITFCITCMNRLFHLKETLKKNIEDNINYPHVEFVLINYNSQDGLDEWVKANMQKYIDQGILSYYYTNEPKNFHASIAKNLAHKVSEGEILCNLDGDNFTGKDFAFYINYMVNHHGENVLLHFRKKPFWGTEGRIVMSRDNFFKLGGYDETFLPIGHEDHDLINRAKAFGLEYHNIQVENFLRYLSNSTLEKSINCDDEPENYYNYESGNRKVSDDNIANNRLVANTEAGWGNIPLSKNFDNKFLKY